MDEEQVKKNIGLWIGIGAGLIAGAYFFYRKYRKILTVTLAKERIKYYNNNPRVKKPRRERRFLRRNNKYGRK